MTERTKQLIEAYIPSPRDPELDDFEYFVEDVFGRIQKGYIRDIIPDMESEGLLYLLYNGRGKITGFRKHNSFAKSDMYDNREDCRNHTHLSYDYWEALREEEKNEVDAGTA